MAIGGIDEGDQEINGQTCRKVNSSFRDLGSLLDVKEGCFDGGAKQK